jgi:LPS-assembly protein
VAAQTTGTGAVDMGAGSGLKLKISPQLQEQLSPAQRSDGPIFVQGERMSSETGATLVIEGDVELRRAGLVMRANRMEYEQASGIAHARGDVHVNQGGNVFEGQALDLQVDSFEGSFTKSRYQLLSITDAHGEASGIDFLDETRAVVHDATFTTCKREPYADWVPAWFLRADTLNMDFDEQVADGEDVTVRFQNVPVLGLPEMTFPLTDARQSGFLSPTFGVDSLSGTEITLPYYWNIAPNRDATFYPTWMSERGMDYNGEFRYLESNYKGELMVDYMPEDKLRNMERGGYAWTHSGGVSGAYGSLGLNLNIDRVSDDNYWRDFPHGTSSLTQRVLPADASVNWSRNAFSATAHTVRWQTLQDPLSLITPPYDQQDFTARYIEPNAGGFDIRLQGQTTQFMLDEDALIKKGVTLPAQPDGQRTVWSGSLSYPFMGPAGFLIPKALLHSAQYSFDAPLSGTGPEPGLSSDRLSATRTVPTYSLDAGLIFERATSYFGTGYRQTLEPRLFYTYTPYVNQNYLPNYDSAAMDFSLDSIYSENAFAGDDRIGDNNLLTAGISTRWFDEETGAEILQLGVAQRLRYEDQRTTLPGGTPSPSGLSDILLAGTLNIEPHWYVDGGMQYNDRLGGSQRDTFSLSYSPSNYRVVDLAYRYQRAQSENSEDSELIDLGWQWPLNDLWGDWGENLGAGRGQGSGRWYSVGRLNYSETEDKIVDAIVGLEYDAGCWLGRVVLERTQTGLDTFNQRIMFQLELVGFARVGVDPLQALQQSIPRYQLLRERTTTPSRFSNYE